MSINCIKPIKEEGEKREEENGKLNKRL